MSRISARFAALAAAKKKAFIPFITAGDPDYATFSQILAGLPKAGCDLIEIGMPFSDPMADGPAIERANLRAFAAGISMRKILAAVAGFRQTDADTPVILMGYYNPILSFGVAAFVAEAAKAGVDGLIIADLPPEEDAELRRPMAEAGLSLIRLLTPTTDERRLPAVLDGAGGFLYYVSVTGITGSKQASADPVRAAVERIRPHTRLPIVVGFGISTPEKAAAMARHTDGVVVGSAIVNRIAEHLDDKDAAKPGLVEDVLAFVASLSAAAHG